MKYVDELLTNTWPLEPCRMMMIKLTNLRARTDKDSDKPVLGDNKNLKFFMGKGRKKGILSASEVKLNTTQTTLGANENKIVTTTANTI